MKVQRFEAAEYRNIQKINILPDERVNVIWGDNAQGKTNLLEAVWLFTGGRSFRGAKDADLVRLGQECAQLQMGFFSENREQQAKMKIDSRRHAQLNGIAMASPAELIGTFCAVVFSPGHLSLVKDGPAPRRRFLDAAICQLKPWYMKVLFNYNRALAQRNALLKDVKYHAELLDLLDVWDIRLAEFGSRIILARKQYLSGLTQLASGIYHNVSKGAELLEIRYKSEMHSESDEKQQEAFREMLLKCRREDIETGHTGAGPHRDDFDLLLSGLSARVYGSQGQQRSVVIALKLAEADLLYNATGEKPVAILDDVMSELDPNRQDYILNHLTGWQVFLTCCDPKQIASLHAGTLFEMKAGTVIQ